MRKMAIGETRKCSICGKEYEPFNRQSRVCSEECRKIHLKEYQNKVNEKKRQENRERLGTRICVVCGREFEPRSGIVVTCSPKCQNRRNHQKAKAWHKEQDAAVKNGAEKKKRSHEENVKEMIDLNRKAHEMGMSYGRYIAYLEMQKVRKVHGR